MRSIIVEGIDRLGKDTLINHLQHELGFFQVLHYQKPQKLGVYMKEAAAAMHTDLQFLAQNKPESSKCLDAVEWITLERYQRESFTEMFKLLNSEARLLLNRAHLGEYVYAPLYRRYPGEYVFDLEYKAAYEGPGEEHLRFHHKTMLVLLHASNLDVLKDDGHSFDWSAKSREQDLFHQAYGKSLMKKKIKVNVTYLDVDGKSKFVPPELISKQVASWYNSVAYDHFNRRCWWEVRDGRLEYRSCDL